MCARLDCDAPYAKPALARILPDTLFEYRAAHDAAVEQRLFEELLQLIRRQYPNAVLALVATQGLWFLMLRS
jgi:hypothetical protein